MSTEKSDKLRARYPEFTYHSFSSRMLDEGVVELRYHFSIGTEHHFRPHTVIRFSSPAEGLSDRLLKSQDFVFHLGLLEMLSYWKASTSPVIKINAGYLSVNQSKWWIQLLHRGMSEFFYRNDIHADVASFVKIVCSHPEPVTQSLNSSIEPRTIDSDLVFVSGGKDSAVTLNTLRLAGKSWFSVLVNPTQAALALARTNPSLGLIQVEREIDTHLLTLNRQGFLNGHTPFSAYLAFLGVFLASLGGQRNVIVSNERSADEGNASHNGANVNHQYSKSFDFEQTFRHYVRDNLSDSISYFSLLRPLYEIEIARRFANLPQFFELFRSCNRGERANRWCGECPKCLSTYLLLSPFLSEEALRSIFGENLLDKESLALLFESLVGTGEKPFECVGTKEESLAAAEMTRSLYQEKERELPKLLAHLPERPNSLGSNSSASQSLFALSDSVENIPREYLQVLERRTAYDA